MRLKVSNVCQLLDKDNLDSFVVGNLDKITVTDNKDGTFIINGSYSNTYNSWYILNEWDVEKGNISQIVEGHKYLLLGDVEKVSGDIHLGIIIRYVDGSSQSNYAGIITSLKTTKLKEVRVQYSIHEGDTADNVISKPQLFDLTEMYGAGNEPTTVAQFRQDFPNEMYDYSPECWKKFRRLKYIANKEPVQLLDKSKYPATKTLKGVTFTNNGDGSITANGTVTMPEKLATIFISNGSLIKGNRYLLAGCPNGGNYKKWSIMGQIYTNDGKLIANVFDLGSGVTFVAPSEESMYLSVYLQFWESTSDLIYKPQLFDLTEMYGAGNEPTTVEQFRSDFPNELYDYNPYNYLTLNRGKYIANKQPVQLLDKSKLKTAVSKGVTATPNTTNGMWTISGAATASEYLQIGVYYPGTDFNIGDKLFLRHSNIDNSVYFPFASYYDKDNKYLGEHDGMGIFSVTNPEIVYIACYFVTRTVGDINVTTQVQLFNLTRMYGKGNEPTAAEFVAQYPGFDYSVNKYNAITFR